MKLKLIVALVSDDKTDTVVDAARASGATGATIITGVRGEGLKPQKTFFGLDLAAPTGCRPILGGRYAGARYFGAHLRGRAL